MTHVTIENRIGKLIKLLNNKGDILLEFYASSRRTFYECSKFQKDVSVQNRRRSSPCVLKRKFANGMIK